MNRTMIPAHPFEPAKSATASGGGDDPRCGYLHVIGVEGGVFCAATSDSAVHNGTDWAVRLIDEEDDNL
jgi:hypothetical protein